MIDKTTLVTEFFDKSIYNNYLIDSLKILSKFNYVIISIIA